MTTTQKFQIKPDYFNSAKECSDNERKKVNTNPRYKFFNQTHFTAGDEDQFHTYRDPTNGLLCEEEIDISRNRFSDVKVNDNIFWEKYKDLNPNDVTNTFRYLFYKFKKGIFIKIKDGRMDVFLPFSNKNFVNEWSDRIFIDPKYGNLIEFVKQITIKQGYNFNPSRVNRDISGWYSNNCLVRYEFPVAEGDTNNPNASDMFRTLCSERKVPDMEFFVNRRDFPLLKNNGTEPYHHIYDSEDQQLLSHDYKKYCPLLSMVTAPNFADIPIPTGDDWSRISRKENKYFSHTCNRSFEMENVPWENRIPTAVFRGASTGCGTTVDSNVRLKLAYISSITPVDTDGKKLLDAGITEWNIRPRKLKGVKYLQTIDTDNIPIKLVERMSPQKQAEHKYLVNVDGHVSAYRLSLELESGSCILLAESKYRMWYRDMLQPYVHYVPVKGDLSDLIEQIKWCKNNDKKCKKIAKNARNFAEYYLCKDGILDYLQLLLINIKKQTGTYLYNFKSPLDIQYKLEREILKRYYPDTKSKKEKFELAGIKRDFGHYRALEWLFNYCLEKEIMEKSIRDKNIIFNNVNTTIEKCDFGGYNIAVKTSKSEDKDSIIHEAFIGNCINNMLSLSIPNFIYTFGNKDDITILEYIEGETLFDYIKGNRFDLTEFLFILIQISLALQVAQNKYGFVHNDLTPWNIMLKREKEVIFVDYMIDVNTIYKVRTKIIPVIIDMGRSHIIYKGIHYGMINMYKTSTIQDVLSLLLTSVFEIASFPLDHQTINDVINLSNFITNTGYRKERFNSLLQIKSFFNKNKKYSELVRSDKKSLGDKTPIDFVRYILNSGHNFPVKIVTNLDNGYKYDNPRQIFDYLLSETEEERMNSFIDVVKRVNNCDIIATDYLSQCYITKSIINNLEFVKVSFVNFLEKHNIKKADKYINQFDNCIQKVREIKNNHKIIKKITVSYEKFDSFSDTIFVEPENVLNHIEVNETKEVKEVKEIKENNLNIEKENIQLMILSLPEKDRDYYKKGYSDILKINEVDHITSIANRNTLLTVSALIYRQNLKHLKTYSCDAVKRYKRIYKKITKR